MTDGRVTGTLSEDAVDVAWEACAPTFETCARGLRIEATRLLGLGITTIADTTDRRDLALLARGSRDGFFPLRAHAYVREELIHHLAAIGLGPIGGERSAVRGVKVYADGSIGARTAALVEPYEDDGTTGMLLRDAKAVASTAERARALGLQMKVHAIGDRAIEATLEGLRAAGLTAADRPRLDHAELLQGEHVPVLRELGAVAVMQPNFIANWQGPGGLYETALGGRRAAAMNPLRSVLDGDVPLAFSSDGMPYGPLYGIQAATQHPTPKQRLTVEESIAAYTRGAAFAIGREHDLGVLREGFAGDAVVLSEDPRRAADVSAVRVELTVLAGAVVHERPGAFTEAA